LPAAYEESVACADAVADRLRREADRVAHLAECHSRQTQLEVRINGIGDKLKDLHHRQIDLQASWTRHWLAAGIDPLTPREMRGWLQRHAALKTMASDIEQQRRRLQQVQDRHDQYRQRIADCLGGVGETTLYPGESLNGLLKRASLVIDRETVSRNRRNQIEHELARCRSDSDELKDRYQRATEDLAAWQLRWRSAMEVIGCPEDASAEQANERLGRLDDLFKHNDELEGLKDRIRKIGEDAEAFSADVRKISERIRPDLVELPVEQAVGELVSGLNKARADKLQRDHLTSQIEQRQLELETAKGLAIDLTQQLAQFCRLAGVPDHEDLPQLELASEEVARRRCRLEEVESQLLDLGGGLPIDKLEAEAEGRDVDTLSAEIADLNKQIEDLSQESENAAKKVGEVENACKAADGSAAAADADQRGLGILSRMHADAERFLRLRLASALLRQQIDRFRAENQDPILTRASGLFACLTCSEFTALRTEYDSNDQPAIVGVRHNEEMVAVEAMSEGTRDQLYLALRLAYLERRLLHSEPMPLVVDDILVNFDDDRAAAALQVLVQLSRQTQVIFFTHHRHLVELAEANLTHNLFVHQLDRHVAREPHSAAVASSRRPR
jgi:uncharacterized protein YhaN